MNTEAWRLHQTLCGRTVGRYDLQSHVIERWTETWPLDDVLDLLARIDIIADVLTPKAAHGT